MLRYIGLLLLIPVLDLILLIVLVPYLGWQLIVLLVVLTALFGLLLARLEGRHTIAKIQRKLMQGEAPTNEVIDGGLLIAAGAFLLTPGLATDALGLLLIIPLTRYPIRWALKRWIIVPYMDQRTGGLTTGNVYVGGFPPSGGADVGGDGVVDGGPDSTGDGGFEDIEGVQDVDFEEVDDGNRTEE